MLLSVVAPVYCEEESIAEFVRRTTAVLDEASDLADYELVLVNDGSTDGTRAILASLQLTQPRLRIIDLSRNFGHQVALSAGLDHARGDAVVVMDADLQDPPELIPALLAEWRRGADVAYARRRRRLGEPWYKRLAAHVYYRLAQRLSPHPVPTDVGDFRILDRAVVDVLKAMPERDRYLRGMVAWVGLDQRAVDFDRAPRHAGRSKYTFVRLCRLALDGLVGMSDVPVQTLTLAGAGLMAVGTAGLGLGLLALSVAVPVSGLIWLGLLLTMLAGLQVFAVGAVGLYVTRIYRQVQGRPLYVVQREAASRADLDVSAPPPSAAEPWGDALADAEPATLPLASPEAPALPIPRTRGGSTEHPLRRAK